MLHLPSAVCMLSHSVMCDSLLPPECSPQVSSVHGILQARILEWIAISFSRGSSPPRDRTLVFCTFCIGWWTLYHCAAWETQFLEERKKMFSSLAQLLEASYSLMLAFWPLPVKEYWVECLRQWLRNQWAWQLEERVFWSLSDVLPSLSIMQLFWSSFLSSMKRSPKEHVGGSIWVRIQISASVLCTSPLRLSLPLSGKYSNHICLALLPVSLKHHRWLSQPPAVLLKAVRFTFSLFWLKHILAKQRTSHFAILTACADCPALVLKTLPKTKFTTVRHALCTWDLSGIWSLIMNAL